MSASDPAATLPRAVLFDWDNTLVDNWVSVLAAFNATLTAFGQLPWTHEESRARIRNSMRDSFPSLFGERWTEARDLFYRHYQAEHLATLQPLPGAEATLAALHGAGIYLGVVSNKSGFLLRAEADHLGWTRFFGRLVGAGDATQDKPSPAAVTLALEAAGLAPGPEVWLVGDDRIDVECARAAGCHPVMVGDGPAPGEDPTLRLGDCRELLTLFGLRE